MILAGSEMVGSLMLLAAMTLFARHVILDAEGLLPSRESPSDDALDGETDEDLAEAGGRWTAIDPPHATPQPAFQRPATSAAPPSGFSPSQINRKLTKGERKALKERLLRERLERQQRGM